METTEKNARYQFGRCQDCGQRVMRRIDGAPFQVEWGVAIRRGDVYGATNCAARSSEPGTHARPHLRVIPDEDGDR